jgi:integrase
MIEQYKRDKQDADLKPNTVNGHLRTLQRVLNLAREWEIIDHAPRVQLLKVTEAKFDYLTFEEAEILPPAAEMPWRAMITVGLKTGLRRGELLGLHREDVNLDGGRLIVRRSFLASNAAAKRLMMPARVQASSISRNGARATLDLLIQAASPHGPLTCDPGFIGHLPH